MKILLSGGHVTPALAMIDFIQAKYPGKHELVFVGRLFSQEKLGQKAIEQDEVGKRGVRFIPFTAPKLTKHAWLDVLRGIVVFPKSVFQAATILRREQIDVFLSFGSYFAVPFALAAKCMGVKIVTHEQTVGMGKANQCIARLADSVAISHEATRKQLASDKKVVLTGNPVRARLFAKDLKKPTWFLQEKLPVILVMGGNQGSFAINDSIQKSLTELLTRFVVVHQCGRANALKNSFAELEAARQALPIELQDRYIIKEWIEDEDLFWLYQYASFAISRAGANTVLELSLAPLPAILIPLPATYQDEQLVNAQEMQRLGGALILSQEHMSVRTLLDSVEYMSTRSKQMRTALAKRAVHFDAAAKLYQVVLACAKAA